MTYALSIGTKIIDLGWPCRAVATYRHEEALASSFSDPMYAFLLRCTRIVTWLQTELRLPVAGCRWTRKGSLQCQACVSQNKSFS